MNCYALKLITLLLLVYLGAGSARAAPALIRYPNAYAGTVVFVARDALWTVPVAGGTAKRLTSSLSSPAAPRFSPNGNWIAFTARANGNEDVYVVPSSGGSPHRLTWSADVNSSPATWWGPNNLVVGWTPDSRDILFLSRTQVIARSEPRLTQVPVAGGLPVPVDLNDATMISYAPDARSIVYSRTYAAYRPWKRYDGGLAPDLFVYRLSDKVARRLTDWKGTDDFPMWVGSKIFFLSDRGAGRRANLWVMDASGQNPVEVTHFRDYDIDFPSYGGSDITFQQGGHLWVLNPATLAARKVDVNVPDDGAATTAQSVERECH